MRGLYDLLRLFPGIYLHMVFLHFDLCRGKAVSAVYFVRELFPSFLSEFFLKLLFIHGMLHHNSRKPFQLFFPFSLFFLWLPAGRILLAAIRLLTGNSLRFVKKYDFPIHFHKRNLVFGFVPLG